MKPSRREHTGRIHSGKPTFHLCTGDHSDTRHADPQRAFLSAVPPGEANAVNVEAKGNRAHYIDGASEPYNRGARHAPVQPMRIPERRDSGILSPDSLHAPKPRLRPHRLDPSFGADASIESFGLAADLLESLRLGVGDGRRSDSEARGAW